MIPEPSTSSHTASNAMSPEKKLKKKNREFDFDRYEKRNIALMVLYLGWDYDGLVLQEDLKNTIEEHLFTSLEKTKLIKDRVSCKMTRCGRTDKGVSAFRQVHSLEVRSNIGSKTQDGDKSQSMLQKELDYVKILNGVLTTDIRVLAWAPVRDEFSARHNCKKRTYKYFFPTGKLNIERMNRAASFLEGTHDFRNFCRLDRNKNTVQTTERRIIQAKIEPCDPSHEAGSLSEFAMNELTIVGTAFLWHQIRCIVGVLLLVGEEKEEPEIVQQLLDIESHPRKPQYPMAADFPLCLFGAEYEDMSWEWSQVNFQNCLKVLQRKWAQAEIKATMLRRMMAEFGTSIIGDVSDNSGVIDVLYPGPQPKNYKPLMQRPTADSLETIEEKKSLKRKLKED